VQDVCFFLTVRISCVFTLSLVWRK